MRDHDTAPIPAAVPSIAFAAGIAATGLLISPRAALVALAACAALLGATPRFRPASVLPVFLALGLACGVAHAERLASARDALAGRDERRFVTIAAPVEKGWERREDVWRLRARSFSVVEGDVRTRIDLPLSVTIWDQPPAEENARAIVAEGALRCDERGCRMSVKSARLLAHEGAIPWWHPAAWNRAAARRMVELARVSPRSRRGAAMASALALGRGEMLDERTREAYRRGGTYHLLVFSGMQIAFAAGVIAFVFRRLGRPRPGDWILLLLAIVAPPFAGHDPSVSRSAIMIGAYAVSRILARPTPVANLLFVSGMIRLALFPEEIREPGFALTWGATGGLILLGGAWARRLSSRLGRALAYGAGAEIGTAPVTAYFFNQVIVASSVVTVVLSPLLSLMLALSAAAVVAAFVWSGAAVLLLELIGRFDEAAVAANELVADRIGIARIVAAPPAWVMAASFLGAAVVAGVLRRWSALAALVLLVPIASSVAIEVRAKRVAGLEVTLLDVGQGDAVLVRRGADAILVDGGGRRGDPAFGRNVLVPLLIDRGVRRMRAVVLTHPDPDHCAGLVSAIRLLDPEELWMSSRHVASPCGGDLIEAARRRGLPVLLADRRPPRSAGSIRLAVLAAQPPFRKGLMNNTSLVVRIEEGSRRILLTGDIERPAEFQLLETARELLAADVLKVAHHGSRSSTSELFLAAARPKIALISAGRGNRYDHPATETVIRLTERGVRILRTDLHGTITVKVAGTAIFREVEIDTSLPAGSL